MSWGILHLALTMLTLAGVTVSAYYNVRTLLAVRTYRRELERMQILMGLLEQTTHLHGGMLPPRNSTSPGVWDA